MFYSILQTYNRKINKKVESKGYARVGMQNIRSINTVSKLNHIEE